MAGNVAGNTLVDAGFIVALLSRRDTHHRWAVAQSPRLPPPWSTCEAVLSEAFHLLGSAGAPALNALLRRQALVTAFNLGDQLEPVLKLMQKHSSLPMSLADACLVRMTETMTDATLLTTDSAFGIYRRHSRQVIPRVTPS